LPVVVYRLARREADPDPAAGGASYRERPMRLVILPLDGKLHLGDEPGLVAAERHEKASSSKPG
jgi:hypothetical protein